MFKVVCLVLVFLGFVNCAPSPSPKHTLKNGFGRIDRETVPSDELDKHPWSAIGKFETAETFCTATLVGERLALTAAHCVIDKESGKPLDQAARFKVGFRFGEAAYESKVVAFWYGTKQPVKKRRQDWAILLLDSNPAPQAKRLNVLSIDYKTVTFPYKVRLAAYHQDINNGNELAVQNKDDPCTLRKLDPENRLLHDCDMVVGSSGAPMLAEQEPGRYAVAALNTSEKSSGSSPFFDEYSEDETNYGIGLAKVAEILPVLQNHERSKKTPPYFEGVSFAFISRGRAKICDVVDQESEAFSPVATNGAKIPGRRAMEALTSRYFSSITSLAEKRGGSAFGLSQTECRLALRRQNNGLICSAGYNYNIYRVGDGKVQQSANGVGIAILETCLRSVEFSTHHYVCVAGNKGFLPMKIGETEMNEDLVDASMDMVGCFKKIRELEKNYNIFENSNKFTSAEFLQEDVTSQFEVYVSASDMSSIKQSLSKKSAVVQVESRSSDTVQLDWNAQKVFDSTWQSSGSRQLGGLRSAHTYTTPALDSNGKYVVELRLKRDGETYTTQIIVKAGHVFRVMLRPLYF